MSAPGSVARIVRVPTIALISVVGPSATMLPVRHQHRPVGVGVGLLEVVGREQDRLAARGERAHRRPERVASLDVHRDRRLVEHEQLGVAHERDREAHALGLSAGQLLRALGGDLAHAGELEHLLDVQRRRDTARPSS